MIVNTMRMGMEWRICLFCLHNEFWRLLEIHVFDDIMVGFDVCAGKSFSRIVRSENYNRTSQRTLVTFEWEILIGEYGATVPNIYKWFEFSIEIWIEMGNQQEYQWHRFWTKHRQRNISGDYLGRILLDTNRSEWNGKRIIVYSFFGCWEARHSHSVDRPIVCKMDSTRSRRLRISQLSVPRRHRRQSDSRIFSNDDCVSGKYKW